MPSLFNSSCAFQVHLRIAPSLKYINVKDSYPGSAYNYLQKQADKKLCIDLSPNSEMIDISGSSNFFSSFDFYGPLELRQGNIPSLRKFVMNDVKSDHDYPVKVSEIARLFPNLELLSLSGDNISFPSEDWSLCKNLRNLKELNFSRTQMTSVSVDLLKDCAQLTSLDLSKNYLYRFDEIHEDSSTQSPNITTWLSTSQTITFTVTAIPTTTTSSSCFIG